MSTPFTAVASTSTPSPRDLVANLPPIPQSAHHARAFVNQSLLDAGLVEATFAERVRLVTSELVTNAIIHAKTELQLRLRFERAAVVVEVIDGAPVVRRAATTTQLATSGRGLVLVAALCDAWGETALDGDGGKKVWARLAVG